MDEDARDDGRVPSSRDAQGGEATRPMPGGEPTSTFDPFADDHAENEATRRLPDDPGTTRPMPTGDEATRRLPADEATRRVTPQIWAARVPAPVEDVPVRDQVPQEWEQESGPPERDRAWVRPVVITVVVAILLAMLGTGLWLIFTAFGRPSTPVPGFSVTPSGTPVPSVTAPATEAPTSAPPTAATATATAPAQVGVPDLAGQSEASAKERLTGMGLTYTVIRRFTAGVAPGTVTATQPGAGTMVGPGTRVTLIVAAPPAATPTPTRTATPAPTASSPPTAGPSHTAGPA
ncbi:PASTA domain-containing protein [Planosporangium sp. 12N6]|uniref:PASTA domain-containing protein n=1 Tax=Planosporangium spinosum TaxID=3402278 RepID=UPI003CEB2E4A